MIDICIGALSGYFDVVKIKGNRMILFHYRIIMVLSGEFKLPFAWALATWGSCVAVLHQYTWNLFTCSPPVLKGGAVHGLCHSSSYGDILQPYILRMCFMCQGSWSPHRYPVHHLVPIDTNEQICNPPVLQPPIMDALEPFGSTKTVSHDIGHCEICNWDTLTTDNETRFVYFLCAQQFLPCLMSYWHISGSRFLGKTNC